MENTLATELLREVKASSKRWFIAFCIMVVLEVSTILGFMLYCSLPVAETITTTTQTVDGINDSEITQVGGNYGESSAD